MSNTEIGATESVFNRADQVIVNIEAEHPEAVICSGEITVTVPDPNLSGIIKRSDSQ